MSDKYAFLMSELNELESIIRMIPAENVIDKLSFESRLNEVRSELELLPKRRLFEKAKITFRGEPVVGSKGMLAGFGAKALNIFSDAFTSVVASFDDSLKNDGRLPSLGKSQLYITGTAIGSFGFELELPIDESLEQNSSASYSMKTILELLEASATEEDDEVAQLVEEIHPRAIRKIGEFLDYLIQSRAWFGLQFEDKLFRYNDIEQLRYSADRLSERNREEKEVSFTGAFVGVLPVGRMFEFKPAAQEIIRGKIDASILDPDVINRNWLQKPTNITLHYMRLGQGKPRYTLKKLPTLDKE